MSYSDSSRLPLGKEIAYPQHYDPSVLFPIPRAENRAKLGLSPASALPFLGVDLWNAFELSWLNLKGKPQIALAEFEIPADSPCMIESKSFKLFLNSLNNERIADEETLRERVVADLSAVAGAPIHMRILTPAQLSKRGMREMDGVLLDRLDIEVDPNVTANPALLKADHTSSPSIQIRYQGRPIEEEGLLRYLIGFRELGEFHEHCAETIFCDIKRQCKPEKLSVYARYTRRGGLDINPFRTDYNAVWPDNIRHARQ
jgi:7-cyano-7-deazaguanine reductase